MHFDNVKKHCTFGLQWLPLFNANYDGYDEADAGPDEEASYHDVKFMSNFLSKHGAFDIVNSQWIFAKNC